MSLKILGLIPARGGSKGVAGKNLKPLGGKPLLIHTIEAVQAAKCVERILVSTDHQGIAGMARGCGAMVPWLRPSKLAADEAGMVDVVLHALERLAVDESYHPDAVMLLQPTSPFRAPATIRAAAEMFHEAPEESVITVSPARDHPFWCKRIGPGGTLEDFLPRIQIPATRQELPPAYRINGVLYLAPAKVLLNSHSFYSRRPRALVIPEEEALDIDTPLDWVIAECLWEWRKQADMP